jgi:hypothetical protein
MRHVGSSVPDGGQSGRDMLGLSSSQFDPQQTIQLGGEQRENSIEPIIYTGADVRWKC